MGSLGRSDDERFKAGWPCAGKGRSQGLPHRPCHPRHHGRDFGRDFGRALDAHQQGLTRRIMPLDELFADTDLGDVGSGAAPEEF
jgi:hypothetical protein